MDRMILGTCEQYLTEYTGTIPEDATLETEANHFGSCNGGAVLSYGKEVYTAEDDLGINKKSRITKEEAFIDLTNCLFSGNVLSKLISTARVTEDTTNHKRQTKVGGIKNDDGKIYLLRLVHKDDKDGDIRVTMVGKNINGLNLTFKKDQESISNAKWSAEPMDADGTLFIWEEDDASIK